MRQMVNLFLKKLPKLKSRGSDHLFGPDDINS